MNNADVNLRTGIESGWTNFMNFVPNFLLFLVILVVGYFLSRLVARLCSKGLHRFGFDRLGERSGLRNALERTKWTASGVVGVIVFWTLFIFTLQLAFSVFGPNPMSGILTGVIAFLPSIFAAILILIVAAVAGTAVKQILEATLGGLSYGGALATGAQLAILGIGVFAALNQVGIAPAIVNGLFYALLAIIVGSAVISIGVGGIAPMRAQWERALGRLQQEAPNIRAAAANAPRKTKEAWQPLAGQTQANEPERELPEKPRFPTTP
jgi:hypothetical protein